jgi:hypothetical protein
MNAFDLVDAANTEIFRLDSFLKVMRIAAFDQVERAHQKDTLPAEDFPGLFDIAIDRLNLIKQHVEKIEDDAKKLLKATDHKDQQEGA